MDTIYNIVDRVINSVCTKINNHDDAIVNMIENRFSMFIEYSCIPERYYNEFLDVSSNMSPELQNLYNSICDIITYRSNRAIWVEDFQNSGYLITSLIETYVTNRFEIDEHIYSILYIDTNILLSDMKKLISVDNKSTDKIAPTTFYRLETIYKDIYEADYIFWDKFNLADTTYELGRLYDILSIRFMRGLGNIFIVKGDTRPELWGNFDRELLHVMNIENIYNMQKEKLIINKRSMSNDK